MVDVVLGNKKMKYLEIYDNYKIYKLFTHEIFRNL